MAIRLLATLMLAFWATLAAAQPTPSEKERVAEMAGAITELMASLEQRAADYPEFLDQLEQGLVDIEQADAKLLAENKQKSKSAAKKFFARKKPGKTPR